MIDFFSFYTHKPLLLWGTGVLTAVKFVVEKYLFADWQFLWFLFVLILLDTILGLWKSWKYQNLSSRGFAGFFEKVALYASFLILVHVLMTFTVEGKPLRVFGWINNVFYSAIVVREAISVIENIGAIKPDLIPSWILAYLKKFDSSGKLADLKNPDDATKS